MTPPVLALVDSGSEHVLAAPWLAQAGGIDLAGAHHELFLGMGGDTVRTRLVDVELRLHAPSAGDGEYVQWQTEVGFVHHWRPTWPMVVGQVGFLDQFTVTLSRHAHQLAIEGWDTFDDRFGAR